MVEVEARREVGTYRLAIAALTEAVHVAHGVFGLGCECLGALPDVITEDGMYLVGHAGTLEVVVVLALSGELHTSPTYTSAADRLGKCDLQTTSQCMHMSKYSRPQLTLAGIVGWIECPESKGFRAVGCSKWSFC